MRQFKIRGKTESYFERTITAATPEAAMAAAEKLSPVQFTHDKCGKDFDEWHLDSKVESVSEIVNVVMQITEKVIYEVHRKVDLNKETLRQVKKRLKKEWEEEIHSGERDSYFAACLDRDYCIESVTREW